MLSYRNHVYSRAMKVSTEATKLALALSMCVAEQMRGPDPKATVDNRLPELVSNSASLHSAAEVFIGALPSEAKNGPGARKLSLHLFWINKRLNEKSPALCMGDPVDISSNDLPQILKEFESWYEQQSPTHSALGARLEPHITGGQLNSALREAWPLFKTRMIATFELADDLDGHELADKLFGKNGATAEFLLDNERKGYLNLFKGLYTLNRNPVAHNDLQSNPEGAAAVLALINSTLIRIEVALDESDSENADGRSK